MQRRGAEYLEDGLLAQKMDEEEKEKDSLIKLQNQASEAFINWIVADENGTDKAKVNVLKMEYLRINQLIENKKNNKEEKENNKILIQQPIRTFQSNEIKLINDHYSTLPTELSSLIDAVLSDDIISLELIPNPIFIRREGKIYDIKQIMELLKDKEDALTPYSRQSFNKSDVIPCNTLIQAMDHLLKVIQGKQLTPKNEFKLSSLNKQKMEVRTLISVELITFIEKHYEQMTDKHKVLFDLICRDPITKQIMDDPVFLPDGYVYDRSTAVAYLGLKNGICPQNPKLSFKKEDITPCYFVIAVLEQLKQNITTKMKENMQIIPAFRK